jgi:hypothetical protein
VVFSCSTFPHFNSFFVSFLLFFTLLNHCHLVLPYFLSGWSFGHSASIVHYINSFFFLFLRPSPCFSFSPLLSRTFYFIDSFLFAHSHFFNFFLLLISYNHSHSYFDLSFFWAWFSRYSTTIIHFLILISFPSSFSSSFISFTLPTLLFHLFFGLSLTHLSLHSLISYYCFPLYSLRVVFSCSLFSSFSSTTVTLFFLTCSRGGLLDIPYLSFIIDSFFFSSGLLIVFSFPPFFHAPSISSTLSFTHPHFFSFSFSSYLTTTLILFIHSYISSSLFFPPSFHVPTLSISLPFSLISSFIHSLLCSVHFFPQNLLFLYLLLQPLSPCLPYIL